MDSTVQSPNGHIRKIEDIIDIQKANGNYSVRQVAFSLPSDTTERAVSAALARSLDSGLSRARRGAGAGVKLKRAKRHASPPPDVVSWPSESDITVLRMKLCLQAGGGGGGELAEVGDVVPGDGLHRPDSSSMVNLATLMLQSQTPSKRSLSVEEYLLPLTSWERRGSCVEGEAPPPAVCAPYNYDNLGSKDSGLLSRLSKKSKVAKFLRLYFCPCCTCLYEMEKMRDEPSVYITKSKKTEIPQIASDL